MLQSSGWSLLRSCSGKQKFEIISLLLPMCQSSATMDTRILMHGLTGVLVYLRILIQTFPFQNGKHHVHQGYLAWVAPTATVHPGRKFWKWFHGAFNAWVLLMHYMFRARPDKIRWCRNILHPCRMPRWWNIPKRRPVGPAFQQSLPPTEKGHGRKTHRWSVCGNIRWDTSGPGLHPYTFFTSSFHS